MKKTTFLHVISYVLLFLCHANLSAQEPFHRKISFIEGLPTQVIFDLHVNQKGLLFMGSDRGLMSYNGTQFKIFPFIDNLALSVNGIKEDADGRLWCKNFSNQVFFLNSKGYLQNFNPISNYFLEHQNQKLVDFFWINKNEFWLLTQDYVLLYQNSSFKKVFSINDRVELITGGDFNYSTNTLTLFTTLRVVQIDKQNRITVIDATIGQKEGLTIAKDFYYVTKNRQSGVFDNQGVAYNSADIPSDSFFISLSLVEEQLWLCTTTGIFEVDVPQKRLKNGFLQENKVTDIVIDKEGNRWVSTLDEGLFMIPDMRVNRATLDSRESKKFLLSLAKDPSGNIFAGDIKGNVYEVSTKGKFKMTYDTESTLEVENIFILQSQMYTSVGLFDLGSSKVKSKAFYGKSLAEDYLGNLVMAGSNFAALVNKNINESPKLPNEFSKDFFITDAANYQKIVLRYQRSRCAIYSFRHQKYYVGYSDGFYAYDHKGLAYEILGHKGDKIIATDLKEDANGHLWVSTSQNGLFKIADQKVVKHFTTTDGLLSTFCRKIDVDDNGVWIATNEGINLYSFKDERMFNISAMMAFHGIAINDILCAQDKIWLATSSGLIFFQKDAIQTQGISNFKINEIAINNVKNEDKGFQFDYYNSRIQVRVDVAHFKSLGKYFIEYRLLPEDTIWHAQPAQLKDITFLSLKPNDYTLDIRLRSGDQISEVSTVFLKVNKPFWMTYWFISLCFISLGLLIYAVYKFALQQSSNKQFVKEQLALSQLTALRSQMNPHFMFNVLNAVQGLIYSNQKTKANEYLGAFSDLMRRTLDVSDKKEISIADELDTIKLYVELEQARFNDHDFEAVYHLPEDKELCSYLIPTLIIQPFVENAIKHGLLHKVGSKLLQISVEQKTSDYWVFVIEDNGIGRLNSAKINQQIRKHQSFATKAIGHRIQLINKLSDKPIKINTEDLLDNFNKPNGTRVTIWIPVKRML